MPSASANVRVAGVLATAREAPERYRQRHSMKRLPARHDPWLLPRGCRRRLRIVSVAAIAAVIAWALPAFAQGPGWSANSTIVKLVVTLDGGVNVRLSPDLTGCVSNGGYGSSFGSVYPSHPGINRIQADLLSAYVTGTPVSVYLNDANCTIAEVVLGGW